MYVSFVPQKGNQVVTATDSGFHLYEVGSGGTSVRRVHSETSLGALSLAALEESTNTLVACIANRGTHLANRVVVLYDLKGKETMTEMHFEDPVVAIRVNMLRLVVIMERRIHMFEWSTLKPLPQISTLNAPNTRGLGALSHVAYFGESAYFAWPHNPLNDPSGGSVPASQSSAAASSSSSRELNSGARGDVVVMDVVSQKTYMLTAHHTSAVTAIEFSPDGKRFATCSSKGTMIRIFASATGDLLFTLRRGTKDAIIDSIVFSASGNLVAVTSNASTLHVFRCDASSSNNLGGGGGNSNNTSETEMRSFVKITVKEGAKYAMGIRSSDEQLYLICKPPAANDAGSSRSIGGLTLEVYQVPRGGGDGRKLNELKLE